MESLNDVTEEDYQLIHSCHWHVEEYHRALKQECNLENFQVRNAQAVLNHIFCSLVAFA